jgi:uncharacterized membrane protein
MAAKRGDIRRALTCTADLRAVRSLSFFLSTERIGVHTGDTPMPAARSAERWLDRLQSVCGCIPAIIGLSIGAGIGWWLNASVYAICTYGVGAAVAAKIATIAGAYFIYRIYLARLCRRLGVVRDQTVVQH